MADDAKSRAPTVKKMLDPKGVGMGLGAPERALASLTI